LALCIIAARIIGSLAAAGGVHLEEEDMMRTRKEK
jgi:hypothetical protein